MNTRLLIDAFVRQTVVLIAQTATVAGVRTPLSHVANQVFLDLTQALEQQGLGRKVVADMFGLALRSYQQKVDRLAESASAGGKSLWEAVYDHLLSGKVLTRGELLHKFSRDDGVIVAGVLHDLGESGLVYRTGRGDGTLYRAARADELSHGAGSHDARAVEACVWSTIYRLGPISRAALASELPGNEDALDAALEALIGDQRIEQTGHGGSARYVSATLLLPLGEPGGFEAGLIEHYGAVVASICAKLRNGQTQALPADQLGGSTFSFDVWPGHPLRARVLGLLATHRAELGALWDAVVAHAREHGTRPPGEHERVIFYFGQLVKSEQLSTEGSDDDAT